MNNVSCLFNNTVPRISQYSEGSNISFRGLTIGSSLPGVKKERYHPRSSPAGVVYA
jgi:hypothetical protein